MARADPPAALTYSTHIVYIHQSLSDSYTPDGGNLMSALSSSLTAQIGETAGLVWHALDKKGRITLAQLAKEVEAPRDAVMQAVGWLAREGKVEIEESGRKRTIALR